MEVSKQIIDVLEYLGEKFGVAIDWSAENVIPFAQRIYEKYIHWEIITSVAWIVIAALMLIIFSIVFVKLVKAAIEEKFEFIYDV